MTRFFNERIEAAHVETPTVEALLSLINEANHTWNSAAKISIIVPTKFMVNEEKFISQFLNPFCWHLQQHWPGN